MAALLPVKITLYARVGNSEVLNVLGTIDIEADVSMLPERNEAGAEASVSLRMGAVLREAAEAFDPDLYAEARDALANPSEPERIAAALAALLPEPSDTGVPADDDRDPRTIVHGALAARDADRAERRGE